MLRLRVKTKSGAQHPLTDQVSGDSSLHDLLSVIQAVTHILPHRQKLLIGFPPKPIIGDGNDNLKSLGIGNGEVLIVEEVEPSSSVACLQQGGVQHNITSAAHEKSAAASTNSNIPSTKFSAAAPSPLPGTGVLLKKVVPSDNSCLFASVYYLINGGETIGNSQVKELRQLVAQAVRGNPDVYHEALLERSNKDYCGWILKDTSWGGGIELSIFSQYYEIEIVALDSKTGNLNRFGEDKKYDYRMIVMYDGIHYDPIYMETFKGDKLYVFPSSDESLLLQAKELAMEAKHSGQFTDTNTFQLECKQCGTIIRGEDEALAHAKNTGHSKFEEVRRN